MSLQGPSGGAFDGGYFQDVCPANAGIAGVGVAYDDNINGVAVKFTTGDISAHGYTSSLTWFNVNPGEYVTGFGGTCGENINQLIVYTNQRCSPLYASLYRTRRDGGLNARICDGEPGATMVVGDSKWLKKTTAVNCSGSSRGRR